MKEKYLPVGTVVLLQNGTKRVMINGFCSIDSEEPTKIYDYAIFGRNLALDMYCICNKCIVSNQ